MDSEHRSFVLCVLILGAFVLGMTHVVQTNGTERNRLYTENGITQKALPGVGVAKWVR